MQSSQFWTWAKTLSGFGQNADGSLSRLAFTVSDVASRRWLQELWVSMHADVHIDGIGNVIGRMGDPPYILLSSHTDSVPYGGHYDGVLGVLAATFVLSQWDVHWGGLMVVDWSSEESSRFGMSTLGSRSACGEADTLDWHQTDKDGISLQDAAQKAFGYGSVPIWALPVSAIRAALELHIEQGTALAKAHQPLAVVTAIAAPQRWVIALRGQANHSGSTLMADRHDALAAAAWLITRIEAASARWESAGLHATVTAVEVDPGASNVIAGAVRLLLDIRAQSADVLSTFSQAFDKECQEVQTLRGVHIDRRILSQEQPGHLSPEIIEVLAGQLRARGMPPYMTTSWPSHDSLTLCRHVPTGMLFVRNMSGVSHQAGEAIDPQDIELGLGLYYQSVKALALGHNQSGRVLSS
ncbi:MAG: hydantoinase/carbamoylase family amidase [Sulfobacillus thermotolerans]|nr:hydantoinase/carbamoylase family amidase [Sulfobacillus thermotolerans]